MPDLVTILQRAKSGDPDAQFSAGHVYQGGLLGQARNLGEAQRWYERAAHTGHVDSMTHLALLFLQDLPRAGGTKDVVRGREWFERAAAQAGALQLAIEVSTVRLDDKHLRSHEFELQRGRHMAIITVKSRGEVTLVGPFSRGKAEGPCRSFPLEPSVEFDDALADFLSRYVEEAATP